MWELFPEDDYQLDGPCDSVSGELFAQLCVFLSKASVVGT
jgi:hypothetical protein